MNFECRKFETSVNDELLDSKMPLWLKLIPVSVVKFPSDACLHGEDSKSGGDILQCCILGTLS